MGDERCDCQRRRLKIMKEPEGHVKDIWFSSVDNGEPPRNSWSIWWDGPKYIGSILSQLFGNPTDWESSTHTLNLGIISNLQKSCKCRRKNTISLWSRVTYCKLSHLLYHFPSLSLCILFLILEPLESKLHMLWPFAYKYFSMYFGRIRNFLT